MSDISNAVLLASLLGYIMGAIPFGLIISKLGGYGDIRDIGSGNIGATNVLRTGNKTLAALTLLLDAGKGAGAILLCHFIFDKNVAMYAGFFAIVGHIFPVWLKFKGGKGVATTLGMYLALAPFIGVAACITWLVTAVIFRYSSLSALLAMLAAPFAAYFIYSNQNLAAICSFIAFIVWIKHRSNIQRLIKRTEPKIGKKKG